MEKTLDFLIKTARGENPADYVVRNVSVFHLTNGQMEVADIAFYANKIAGVGTGYHGTEEFDGTGLIAVPGFIDSHLHVESSLLVPSEFERMVVPHGVTTAVCDPHEMANVVGDVAYSFFLRAAYQARMHFDVRFSSCVPATEMETAGGRITADDLLLWHWSHPHVALGEFMNVPGVLFQDPDALQKLECFDKIDGHCPLLSGKDLNAYAAAGVANCHESSSYDEALEKLQRGMQVLIREGSCARNLEALLPLITLENAPFLGFCTDDRNPLDVAEYGHIDAMIRRVIAAGVSPLVAYRIACYSPAVFMQLGRRGLVAPGYDGDVVLLSNLEQCRIEKVICCGTPFDASSGATFQQNLTPYLHTVKCAPVSAEKLQAKASAMYPGKGPHPVIGVTDGQILTEKLTLSLDAEDVLPCVVVERHGINGNISVGYVKGFQIKNGALASSVGHDSHNLCAVGTSFENIAVALNALIECQGGFVVAQNQAVTALQPLPVVGLMSASPFEKLVPTLRKLGQAARDTGCPMHSPFLQLAFLPLPVIPHLKLTDKGLVDVDAFRIIVNS